jgi:hypothetical protein
MIYAEIWKAGFRTLNFRNPLNEWNSTCKLRCPKPGIISVWRIYNYFIDIGFTYNALLFKTWYNKTNWYNLAEKKETGTELGF